VPKHKTMQFVDDVMDISGELEEAERKYPTFPVDVIHAAAIVGEEAGELLRAALRFTYEAGTVVDLRNEALHTATMAVRFLMNIETLKGRR